ncbi:MAG: YceI family protein [Steroidobacteraceae bacterium]
MPVRIAVGVLAASALASAYAAPVAYEVDADHTYPSFAADHSGGLSKWRGKFNTTSGRIVLDREAKTGSVEITVETASIDFGLDRMNTRAQAADLFDVEKYPKATYRGTLAKFRHGVPTEVHGTLTLHGVTKPVNLAIRSFLCKPDLRKQRERCGADAAADINRGEFGIRWGESLGDNLAVKLEIQVEALRAAP